jgi:mono/diheme cytochrome c family protein
MVLPAHLPRVLLGALVLASVQAAPADLFNDYCAACHGVDGKARTPAGKKIGAKDLSLSQLSDAAIADQIANGKKNERGAEKMPPFKDKLKSEEITALVGYVKGFRK